MTYKGFIGAVEEVFFQDKDHNDNAGHHYKLTPWACRSDGDDKKAFDTLILKLEPTYIKATNQTMNNASPARERNRVSTSTEDTDMDVTSAVRKIGDLYDPDMLTEHRGPFFAHSSNIKLVQRDHRNINNQLIAPHELKKTLVEGTLFSAQITLHTYTFSSGNSAPNKIYHIYVEKLKILDRGYGEPWDIPIPNLPTPGPSPQKKRRLDDKDDTADDAFNAF
ncbi:hypothetical protein K438DRAFT_1986362 [Mycena galopus ATCC 62051]|nr:hypothetical protein K438DRAFT_1986362 [Mycena galopus ATCC 62051]